ncbi:MAG: CUAEP/CCAEP-tail radical SAM protein [Chloroflexota bacterium]|nr:CUAEP/CCAEP-tail radical SAM protein [Chloroflexota bacterium]
MLAPTSLDAPGTTLRAPGAILLLSVYELGHQPLSLAFPLAALRERGYSPRAIDISIDDLPDDALRAARLVAVSVPMHTAMRLGVRLIERVRAARPDAHLCFYGLYAQLNAAHLLAAGADSVIGGEVEGPLGDLAAALEIAHDDLPPVPGVTTASHVAAPFVGRHPFPTPDRTDLPPLRRYAGFERDGVIVPAGYVEATRGCHHTCAHCPITPVYGGRFVVVPREVVLADIAAQVAQGARHITFGDPDFFNGPGHSMRLVRELHRRWPGLTYDATIKIEHLLEHRRLLPELAATGCAFVISAVESLNPEVLANLRKGHTTADVAAAIAALDGVGIPMRPSLLPFSPWETIESYLDLLHFVALHGMVPNIDPVHYSIRLLIPPGSAVLDAHAAAPWLGSLDTEAFTYRWTHPDSRFDTLQSEIAAIAERAAARNKPPETTFATIWQAAYLAAGLAAPPVPVPRQTRPRPPRLTESWFC